MPRRFSTVSRLRYALLALLLGMGGILVGLLVFGRAGAPEESAVPADEADGHTRPELWDEDVAVQGEGFEFTLRQEGRRVFRIQGDASRSDRDDNVFLEKVTIHLPRSNGEYEIESDTATYDQRRHEAKLQGNVHVAGPDGIELDTRWLELRQRGTVLVASQGSEFGIGKNIRGSAHNLRLDLDKDVVVLSGGVTMASERRPAGGEGPPPEASPAPAGPDDAPGEVDLGDRPFALKAHRIVLEKLQHRLLAEGDVEVDRGFEHLEAQRVSLFLDDGLSEIRFLRALTRVKGRVLPPLSDPAQRLKLHFRGNSLSILFDPGTGHAVKMELEGTRRQRALLRTEDQDGSERRLNAVYLTADLVDGFLDTADALGPVTLVEHLVGPNGGLMIRVAEALNGNARFDTRGNLIGLTLEEAVVLKERDVVATGERGFLDLTSDRAELLGTPVLVKNRAGELEAPKVTYSRTTGMMHAVDGVRAALEEEEGGTGPLPMARAGGKQPVRVVAQESFLRDSPQSFLFRGDVRAWQGRNLILADQLRGEGGERMSASGNVKTVWYPPEEAGQQEADPEAEEAVDESDREAGEENDEGERLRRSPVEITARNMSFAQADRLLVYNGDVTTEQAGRTLLCNEMTVRMGEESQAEELHCQGETRLLDPATGRTIEGTEAIYFVELGEVLFYGAPITLDDPQRGRVEAKRLRYRLEDGQLWMGAAAETSQPSG